MATGNRSRSIEPPRNANDPKEASSLDTIAFTVDGRDDWILARQRDDVSFVYTLKSGTIEEMLSVLNLTTGAASGVGGFFATLRATTPKQKLGPQADAQLSQQQALLAQKREIVTAGTPVLEARDRHEELLKRLERLRGKMEAVGAELYLNSIPTRRRATERAP